MSFGASNQSADPPLVKFFDPVTAGKDNRGRTLSQILAWNDVQLERVHDYIQFLFPLVVPSRHNRTAFLIDRVTLVAFRDRPELRARLKESFLRMLSFYGLELVEYSDGSMEVKRGTHFAGASRNWISSSNHNYQRITRILGSLKILGLEAEALAFYLCLQEKIYTTHQDKIPGRTMQIWTEAATQEIALFSATGNSNSNEGNLIQEVLALMEHQEQVGHQQQQELRKQEEGQDLTQAEIQQPLELQQQEEQQEELQEQEELHQEEVLQQHEELQQQKEFQQQELQKEQEEQLQKQSKLQQQIELQKREEELRKKLADRHNIRSSQVNESKADTNRPESIPVVSGPVQNRPANSSYDLVFGVEMKILLVMHERLIIEQLTSGYYVKSQREAEISRRIYKNVVDEIRRQLCRVPDPYKSTRSLYLGWAIPTPPGSDDPAAMYTGNRNLRTYGLEPLEIAREALRSSQQVKDGSYWDNTYPDDFNVNIYHEREARIDYNQWCLIPANEIEALRNSGLGLYLRRNKRCNARDRLFSTTTTPGSEDEQPPSKRIKTIHYRRKKTKQASPFKQADPLGSNPDALDWDTSGVELVSNLLRPTQANFKSISDVCDKLKGIPCNLHGAIPARKDGLHVHLKPAHSDFDILTLQHLAYILIMYEPFLNTLFPAHRRTESGSDVSKHELHPISYPLRAGMSTDQVLPISAQPDNEEHTPSNLVIQCSLTGLPRAHEQIFTHGTSVPALWKLLGGRTSAVVDFTPLVPRSDPGAAPRTVEFRQHESVLRADMIRHWVLLCSAVVQLAHRKAQLQPEGPDVRGAGYAVEEWVDTMSVWDLLDDLDLDKEARAYWRRRGAYLAA